MSLEDRFPLLGESVIGAREILGLHAQRLGDGLLLDGVVDAHCPLHVQHPLGDAVGECRPIRKAGGEGLRLREQRIRRDEAVEEAPALPTRVERLLAAVRGEISREELNEDLQCAADAVAIIEACYASSNSGAWVNVDALG